MPKKIKHLIIPQTKTIFSSKYIPAVLRKKKGNFSTARKDTESYISFSECLAINSKQTQ